MRPATPRRGGFTLIEMVSVIVLLSLVAASAVPLLTSAGQVSELDRSEARVRDADARARLVTRNGVVCGIATSANRNGLELQGSELPHVQLPAGCTVGLLDAEGAPIQSISIDLVGRSEDYSIVLVHDNSARTLNVYGLTGWIAIRESSP